MKRKSVRQKPVAVFDIDGTLYRSNFLVDLVDTLVIQGILPQEIEKLFEKEYAHWKEHREREHYIAYIDRLIEILVMYIPTIDNDKVQKAADYIMEKVNMNTYIYGKDIINKYKKSHFLLAISGSPSELVDPYSKKLGMDDYHASYFEVKNGKYTGKAKAGNHEKDKTLLAKVKEHNLTLQGSIGMGDTESDIPMLELVERPIAFNPNKELLEHALKKGWEIISEHKDTIYHISQGKYRKEGNFGHFYTK